MERTYTNPVYAGYFADPFVLRHDGRYYAYGTGPGSPDGGRLPILASDDLVNWEAAGWALWNASGDEFWAPEVASIDGAFVMYYSARGINGQDHQLRAAASDSPLGPFHDAGRVLVPDQPFSIDPHPFRDDDGQWYLFYAQDFLTLEGDYRIGTGIVVDRLLDPATLAGEPRIVVRPFADWHLFKSQRSMYGSVYDWHTVEGPAVRKYDGRYFCFYSGGAWERENYGISYVVADHPLGPYAPLPDIATPIMQSVPGQVIGPGHNSFVASPDETQTYCVYHAWDLAMTARTMRIDLLTWTDGRPAIHGPTWLPQPAPPTPE